MKERCDREWSQRAYWCSLGEEWGWDHNPKQLNSQQRGQHRRLGNAHGARDDPEASFRRAGNAPWAALTRKRKIRSLFRRKTGCRGWGYKQSRPLPRAVRAATLCLRCSPSPGRELQIRRKKTIATILATTQGRNSNFKLAYPLSKRFFSEADPSGKETGISESPFP